MVFGGGRVTDLEILNLGDGGIDRCRNPFSGGLGAAVGFFDEEDGTRAIFCTKDMIPAFTDGCFEYSLLTDSWSVIDLRLRVPSTGAVSVKLDNGSLLVLGAYSLDGKGYLETEYLTGGQTATTAPGPRLPYRTQNPCVCKVCVCVFH